MTFRPQRLSGNSTGQSPAASSDSDGSRVSQRDDQDGYQLIPDRQFGWRVSRSGETSIGWNRHAVRSKRMRVRQTDRRRNGQRRKEQKLTPFDIASAIARWIAGETQTQIAKSLGYADGSNVSTDIGMFVIHNLPKDAYEKYGPPAMRKARLSVRKELARLALDAFERHSAA